MDELQILQKRLTKFAKERDWEQFHSPKNLASALIVEAAELLELYQWLSEDESRNLPESKLKSVEEELADIFIYLVRISTILDIDLLDAAKRKITLNESKYPANRVKGSAAKYTEYE